jgi:hypothetical protein
MSYYSGFITSTYIVIHETKIITLVTILDVTVGFVIPVITILK